MIEYSVIIPLYNEEENIIEVVEEIEKIMKKETDAWEMILINDGSTDQSEKILSFLLSKKPYLKVISFDRNYGQSSAFDAGFQNALGSYVITLDGDGQNDPEDIPKMIPFIKTYDLVCGIRQKRKDSFFKKIISFLANKIRKKICKDGMDDTGCSLKIYKKEALKKIKLFDGMHRFLPTLFIMEGFKITAIPVRHRKRKAGTSKYSLWNRSFNTIFDLFAVRWMQKRCLQYKIVPFLKNNQFTDLNFEFVLNENQKDFSKSEVFSDKNSLTEDQRPKNNLEVKNSK